MSSIAPPRAHAPSTQEGAVVCAIGDIHGRLDLVEAATETLRALAERAAAEHKAFITIFLGDYIDRGPDSAGVISHLIRLRDEGLLGQLVFLRGNHEQVLLDLIDRVDETAQWLEFGGVETLSAYGVDRPSPEDLARQLQAAVPADHVAFLRDTRLYAKAGDYIFVHAGLRPDRLLEEQSAADMLWFRYYEDEQPVHGEIVVHGHSPNERPIQGRWRIGIDTEAYASGALTILALDGEERQFFKVLAREPGSKPEVSSWEGIDRSYNKAHKSHSSAQAAAPKALGATRSASGRRRGGMGLGLSLLTLIGAAALATIAVGVMKPSLLARARGLLPTVQGSPAQLAAPAAASARAATIREPLPPQPSTQDTTPPPASLSAPLRGVVAKDAAAPPPWCAWSSARTSLAAPTAARVQIGALSSQELAEQAWRKLVARYPAQMQHRTLTVEPAVVDGKSYFRAFVDGFATFEEARDFCGQVGSPDQGCIPRRGATSG